MEWGLPVEYLFGGPARRRGIDGPACRLPIRRTCPSAASSVHRSADQRGSSCRT